MSAKEIRPEFRRRLRAVARQVWALHVARGVAWTVLIAATLVAMVAAADYVLELSRPARAGLLSRAPRSWDCSPCDGSSARRWSGTGRE